MCFNTHITSELQPLDVLEIMSKGVFQYPYNERVATFRTCDKTVNISFQYPYNERVATDCGFVIENITDSFNTHITSELQPEEGGFKAKLERLFQYPYNERVATYQCGLKV